MENQSNQSKRRAVRPWHAAVAVLVLGAATGWLGLAARPQCCAGAAATCTGSSSCRACRTCSSCGHCAKRGGTCGVCAAPVPRPTPPRPKPPRPDRDERRRESEREREAAERRRTEAAQTEAAVAARHWLLGRTLEMQGKPAAALDHYHALVGFHAASEEARKAAGRVAALTPAYQVVRVVDGDTVVLADPDGDTGTVRLVGVDTPETVHPTEPVERFGREASDFLKGFLEGRTVHLRADPQGDRVDRYGRYLAYVYRAPEMTCVNLKLVADGYGHAYTRYPFEYMDEFRAAERAAREARRGLWAPPAAPTGDGATPQP